MLKWGLIFGVMMLVLTGMAAPPKTVTLDWQYPQSLPCAGLQFEIWYQTTAMIPEPIWGVRNGVTNYWAPPIVFGDTWIKVMNVSAPPVKFTINPGNMFFIVRATNLVTRTWSAWATNISGMKGSK